MNKVIAIQGAEGSNHHKVARDFYGSSIQLKECMSFDVLVGSLLDERRPWCYGFREYNCGFYYS